MIHTENRTMNSLTNTPLLM